MDFTFFIAQEFEGKKSFYVEQTLWFNKGYMIYMY